MEIPKIKVLTVVGTRPEIIRLSRVINLLNKYTNHILVHTGQNYDYELNDIFFKELDIPRPNHFMAADVSSLGATVGDIIYKSEDVLKKEKPDAVLILGDTNSCLFGYMAKRMHIPIFHMEAGNRCFDLNVPEETNRKIIDHIADFNLVYTEHARRHLLSEGLPHRRIYLTGSPLKEVIDYYLPQIKKSSILKKLKLTNKKYFIVSFHREENVDNQDKLIKILMTLNTIAEKYKLAVVVSTHPRTSKRIEKLKTYKANHRVQFMKPFGYFDYVFLQMNALCSISDSGTISEESAILSFPAISLRQSMERPEAQDAGTIILTGFEPNVVINSIETTIKEHKIRKYLNNISDYSITDTSWRVLKLVLGNASLSNFWNGIEN